LRGSLLVGNGDTPVDNAASQEETESSFDPNSDMFNTDSLLTPVNRKLDEVAYWRHQVGWRDDDYYSYEGDFDASANSANSSGKTTQTVTTIVTVIKVVGLVVAATILLLLFRAIRRRFAESKKNSRVNPASVSKKSHGRAKSSPSGRSSSSVHSRARSKSSSGRSRSKSRRRRSKSVGGTPKSSSMSRSGGVGSDYSLMSDEISTRSGRESRRSERPSSRMSRSRSRSRHRSASRNGTPRESVSSPRQNSIDSIEKREMLV